MLPASSQHLQEINFIETVKKIAVFWSSAMCIIQATVRSRQKYICCICRSDSHIIRWFMSSGSDLWLSWLKFSSFRHLMFLDDKTSNTKARVVVTWNEFSCIFLLPRKQQSMSQKSPDCLQYFWDSQGLDRYRDDTNCGLQQVMLSQPEMET